MPSYQEAYAEYLNIFQIIEDKNTQFLTLSISHKSPFLAKEWLDIVIYHINESMREIDKDNAENAINYLNMTEGLTNIQSLKDVTSSLLESQMQVLMLAASGKEYVFKTINAPIVTEFKSSPKRALICISITLLGAMFSIFFVLLSSFLRSVNK